jgi:type I restriction enzyme S subunit
MSFPRYERYKDSGVEWLGEVPEHWDNQPLYRLGKEREESNDGLISENLLSLSYGRIIRKDIGTSDGLLPESFETYQIIHPGDIVFRLTDLQNDKRSLRTAMVHESGIITFAYVAFEATAILPAYLNYLLRDYDLRKIFYSMGGGVRQSMKFDDIKRLPTLVPPKSEQSSIVKFLDHEITKIDALIEEQRHLIELLKEKRQAVISHAVTKGLDPNVPMKESGVVWIGGISTSWTLTKLGRACFMQEGPGLRHWQFTDQGVRVICVTNITEEGINFATYEKFISNDEYNSTYLHFTVETGDILLSSSGNSWGKVAIYEGDQAVILNTSTIRLSETKSSPLLRDFLALLLRADTVREQLSLAMTGSCQPNFGPSHLKTVRVALPSKAEQRRIVSNLGLVLDRLADLLVESQSAISLFEERRSAIISAAVTGKIDVRNCTPKEAA